MSGRGGEDPSPAITLKLAAGVEPNETAVAPVKSPPMIETWFPPTVDPVGGWNASTAGGASQVNSTLVGDALPRPG